MSWFSRAPGRERLKLLTSVMNTSLLVFSEFIGRMENTESGMQHTEQ